jgi:hypothetical protein
VKKSVYCGGGFFDNQLLWIIPILDAYCEANNINTIIFERKLSNRLLKNIYISSIVRKYHILNLKSNLSIYQLLNIIFFFFKNFFKIIYYSLIINRKILLSRDLSWKKIQIYHSIWDTSFFYLKDGNLNPNFFHKFKSSLRIFLNIYFAIYLKKKNIFTAFMNHSVYSARAMIAIFRDHKIKIIIQANHSLYILPLLFDNSWSIFDKKTLIKLRKKEVLKSSISYWNGRLMGHGNYEDAKIAFHKKNYKKNNHNFNNVILLHIFRDSPFNVIDRKRIFSDYVDWIDKTLRILKYSKEDWIIRPHPNFKRWGENSYKIYKDILNKIANNNDLKNVKFLNDKIPNIELLKKARRILTFSGTVHVEAACLGIKPIVISDCTLSNSASGRFVFKPKNLNQYKNLLLANSNSSIFKLNNKQKRDSIFMLFIRESIVSLRKDLGAISIYRSDSDKIRDYEFNNIYKNLDKKNYFLRETGKSLGTVTQNTISQKYLKYFIK